MTNNPDKTLSYTSALVNIIADEKCNEDVNFEKKHKRGMIADENRKNKIMKCNSGDKVVIKDVNEEKLSHYDSDLSGLSGITIDYSAIDRLAEMKKEDILKNDDDILRNNMTINDYTNESDDVFLLPCSSSTTSATSAKNKDSHSDSKKYNRMSFFGSDDENMEECHVIENKDTKQKKQSGEKFIKRNNITDKKMLGYTKKKMNQKPNGATYTMAKDLNAKEIEERIKNNLMPPQPEYFDPDNKELGYTCNYDVKHPHPYINPFEMFIFIDKIPRKKLQSINKYSYPNISSGRIICLLCAILHKKEIESIDQLQDWDVIETYGDSLRQCTRCGKMKKEHHFNHNGHHQQCTYCGARKAFTNYHDGSDG